MSDSVESLLEGIDFDINLDKKTYNHNGTPVPRVTEILSSMLHEEYLMRWANSLGFKHKQYTVERDKSANIGTKAHNAIEKYLKEDILPEEDNVGFYSFKKWWDIINESNTVIVLASEITTTCPWFGGTADLVVSINGIIYLVDFKTSNSIGYKHFLQLGAYHYMLSFAYPIQGWIILHLDKDIPSYNEYVLNFNNQEQSVYMNHCIETFLSLTYGYYNRVYSENLFKSIF